MNTSKKEIELEKEFNTLSDKELEDLAINIVEQLENNTNKTELESWAKVLKKVIDHRSGIICLLYTSPSPRD